MKMLEVLTGPDSALHVEKNEANNYAAVRYNAMKHGVLSENVVLPHEKKAQFDELLEALVSEHQPGGATEGHLVEELAGIIWRKRRILLAEGAKINRGLRNSLYALGDNSSVTVKNAVPSDPALCGEDIEYWNLLAITQEELQVREKEAVNELEATDKAIQILKNSGSNAYEDALSTLPSSARDWWQNLLDGGMAEAINEDLRDLISDELLPNSQCNLAQIRHHVAIKHQVIGEGIGVPIMESLSRYETHLDRKFERTLAMLIKLKELRSKK